MKCGIYGCRASPFLFKYYISKLHWVGGGVLVFADSGDTGVQNCKNMLL